MLDGLELVPSGLADPGAMTRCCVPRESRCTLRIFRLAACAKRCELKSFEHLDPFGDCFGSNPWHRSVSARLEPE